MGTWHAASGHDNIYFDLMTASQEGNRVFNSLSEENRDKRCQQYGIHKWGDPSFSLYRYLLDNIKKCDLKLVGSRKFSRKIV